MQLSMPALVNNGLPVECPNCKEMGLEAWEVDPSITLLTCSLCDCNIRVEWDYLRIDSRSNKPEEIIPN